MQRPKVSDTAKPVMAIKYVTSQPSFWQAKGCGKRETPLSHNECAKIFLTDEDIEKAKVNPYIDNIKTVSVRERWVNKLLHESIKKNGFKQVVILGSGFDIRPYKKNSANQSGKKNADTYAQVKFWEVDKAEVLDEKEAIFSAKNLDKNATYIRADYTKTDFVASLVESGLSANEPTLIIFEGNSMYLDKAELDIVFTALHASLRDFVIAFDYFPQSVVDVIAARAKQGSNEVMWKTGIDNLEHFATQRGLRVVDLQSIGSLSKQYDVDQNPSIGAQQYSVCALKSRP